MTLPHEGAALAVTSLSAGYNRREVVRDVSLHPCRPGETVAILGPNAAGKSTLLKGIAGLASAKGTVRLGQTDLLAAGAAARADLVGFMPQYTLRDALRLSCPTLVWTGHEAGTADLPQFRELRVVSARDVTPRMRRLRLAGESLARCATGELHVRLLIPPVGRRPVWPQAGPAAIPVWPAGEDRLVTRTYTLRRVEPERGFVEIDFALHDAHGPACAFARLAEPGAPVGIMGPGGGGHDLSGPLVLAGDETALPAIARALEALPEDASGLALIEIHDGAERQPLRHPAGVRVEWLSRGGRPPGTTTLLCDALIGLGPMAGGDVFVWSGSEFASFKSLRGYCRKTLGMGRARHHVAAYWRRGSTADAPDDG